MFLAAFASLRDPESKTFYDRKRAEGKKHDAALICLARRRCDVILAMLRDHERYLTPTEREEREVARQAARGCVIPLDKNMGTPPGGRRRSSGAACKSRFRVFDRRMSPSSSTGDAAPRLVRLKATITMARVAYREEMEDHAVGYMRVSSNRQLVDGGVAAQEASIHAYCLQHHLRLLRIDRDQSESNRDALDTRSGMAAALRSLEAGEASVLVVYDRTQLSGDAVLLETTIQRLGQAGARVLSIIGPDSDGDEHTNALIHRVLGAVDQYNKAVIRAKTEASQAHAGAEGRRGPSPYGYRSERGRLRQVPNEQEVLARIGQLRGAGASLRAICRELNDAGVTSRTGGRWRPHAVSGALHTGALGDETR